MRGRFSGAVAAALCVLLILSAGCSRPGKEASYRIGDDGILQVSCPAPVRVEESVLSENASLRLA
jgi:hypothetical protein